MPKRIIHQNLPIYHPLILQCGLKARTSKCDTLRTRFVCWPDHCDPHWNIVGWSVISFVFFVADVCSDVSVALEYYIAADRVWGSLVLSFVFIPGLVSIGYFVLYKRHSWYKAYPIGLAYWSWKTVYLYFTLPRKETLRNPADGIHFLKHLRNFQTSNRERTRVMDVDVYFGAMPQLILQSYIASEIAIETGAYSISWTGWLSLFLSAANLLRYEPSARHSEKGIIIDDETVLEPALYDYLAENIFDFLHIVPRAVAIGCFLTVKPVVVTAVTFFMLHILVTFLWFYLSAPKRIDGQRSSERDFRGQRRHRQDYLLHLQASIATLLFPPTNRAWPTDFESWTQRLRAAMTKQFCVVTAFQLTETLILLVVWIFFVTGMVPVVTTSLCVLFWSTTCAICHVTYYTFMLFPLYTQEWEGCFRRRGLIAKSEIIRMCEEVGAHFCRHVGPVLARTEQFSLSISHCEKLRIECQWLTERFLKDSVGSGTVSRSRTQRHRLMAMGPREKDLVKAIRRHAGRCLELMNNEDFSSWPEEALVWQQLNGWCHELAAFWAQVLLACLTHQFLPSSFYQQDRDLVLSQYPKMFNSLVAKNFVKTENTHLKKRSRKLKASSHTSLPSDNGHIVPDPDSDSSYGHDFNFEFIT